MWKEGKNLLLGTTFKDCEIGEEKKQTQEEEGLAFVTKPLPPPFQLSLLSPLLFIFFLLFQNSLGHKLETYFS